MKELISKAIALGLGMGAVTAKKVEELARQIEKQAGLSKRDSAAFVKTTIKQGEALRQELEQRIVGIMKEAAERLMPVTRREFSEFKAAAKKAAQKRPRRNTPAAPRA